MVLAPPHNVLRVKFTRIYAWSTFSQLHVNDLPLITKFSVTLYADDTYLLLSDNYLGSLGKK